MAEIDKNAKVFAWSDSDKLIVLRLKLSAELSRQSGISKLRSYHDAEQAVRKRLGLNQDRVASQLAGLERGPNENVMSAFYRLVTLLENPQSGFQYLPSQFKRAQIKDNLKKICPRALYLNFISSWASSGESVDLNDVSDLLETLSNAFGPQKTSVNALEYCDAFEKSDAFEYDDFGELNAVASRGPIKCHFCSQVGHYMNKCPEISAMRSNQDRVKKSEQRMERLEQKLEKSNAETASALGAILKQLEALNNKTVNSVETPRADQPSENKRPKGRAGGKPRCFHCPLNEDGFPPRHFPAACPFSARNNK